MVLELFEREHLLVVHKAGDYPVHGIEIPGGERPAVGGLQDGGVSPFLQVPPESLEHLREKGDGDALHHRFDRIGALGAQIPGHGGGGVLQLLDGRLDPFPGTGQHTVRVLQIFRYTSHRKPRQRGYLFDVCHKAPSRRLWMDFYREITAG